MNGTLKSLDDYIHLFEVLLIEDLARMHGEKQSFYNDFLTIKKRTINEGLSFLTKTLPSLGKEIDQSLLGKPLISRNFKNLRGTSIPVFLQALTRKVFDIDGKLLPTPSYVALNDLRQVCFLLYKLEVPYAEKLQQKVIDRFISTDQELMDTSSFIESIEPDSFQARVLTEGRSLVSSVFRNLVIRDNNFFPKHGPGAVATGEKSFEKMQFKRFYTQLSISFPYEENFFLSYNHLVDELDTYLNFDELDYGSSKVVLVPKDSRGPRLIAMEPLEYQWIQQGIKSKLYNFIESHPLTKGFVNFTDQNVNRELALASSRLSNFATLDMKDASDSVSTALVTLLFSDLKTDLLECLLASRSVKTLLPDGNFLTLKKFAPMGSAVCFPVEAIVFWVLAVSCINVYTKSHKGSKVVYVYGDDIIVPQQYAELLIETFPHFNLKFNPEKCCYSGLFRESCGCDAFNGEDITPIKIRKIFPSSKHDGQKLYSFVDYSNQFWKKGFYATSEFLSSLVEKVYGKLPFGIFPESEIFYESPTLLRRFTTDFIPKIPKRYNKNLQRFEIKVPVVKPARKIISADSWSELFRSFFVSSDQLAGHYDIPRKTKIIYKWIYNPHVDISLKKKRLPQVP